MKVSYIVLGFQKSIKLSNRVWCFLPDTWAPDSSLPAYTQLRWRVCYHGDVWAVTLIKASRVYIYLETSGYIFLGMILQAPSFLLEDHVEGQWNIFQSCPSLSRPVPEGQHGSRSHRETSDQGHKEPQVHGKRQAAAGNCFNIQILAGLKIENPKTFQSIWLKVILFKMFIIML